jgi:hypothetical protein
MNPVQYTLNVQRTLLIATSLGFIGISAILVFLNPYENEQYVWLLLGVLSIFLASLLSLLSFWWFFSIQKRILTIIQVNQLVYQSIITSGVLVLLLVMQQTRQLNIWSGVLVFIVYFFYELWINLE